MKRKLQILFALLAFSGAAANLEAATLTFDTNVTPGVSMGGNMLWDGTGGGHLFNQNFFDTDYIYFSSPTFVNSFEMNALPWAGYSWWQPTANITMSAYDASNIQVWTTAVDLLGYTNWSNWLTVNVNAANVTTLEFIAPGLTGGNSNGFWPSIDNMIINQSVPTPEPSTFLLLGSSLLGAAVYRKKIASFLKKD